MVFIRGLFLRLLKFQKSLGWDLLRLFFLAILFQSLPFALAEEGQYWVSIGSFKVHESAQAVRSKASKEIQQQVEIISTETAGGLFHRVVVGPFASPDTADETLKGARTSGYEDAWIISMPIATYSTSDPLLRNYFSDEHAMNTPSEYSSDPPSDKENSRFEADNSRSYTEIDNAAKVIDEPVLEAPANYSLHKLKRQSFPSNKARARLDNRSRLTGMSAGSSAPSSLEGQPRLKLAGVTREPIEVRYYDDVEVAIDGRIDESVWSEVVAYDGMVVTEPDTLDKPDYETVSRFFFTSKGLYVGAFMEQPPDTFVARLSSRDRGINRDGYGITLDTSGQGLYGYWFAVNLGGSLQDGKVMPERDHTDQWDGPWLGQSAELVNGWSAELFLPWSMMAIPEAKSERKMGLWINRKVAHVDERYGWPALPYSQARFMSALQPVSFPGLEPRRQFAIVPYTSASHDVIKSEQEFRAGVDFAWRPLPNMQLTATFDPDFGAVESDDVVVNLTAFETSFPEKRLFFLEGSEVFITSPRSNYGTGGNSRFNGSRRGQKSFSAEPTTLINTRRIGGAPKHVVIPDGIEVLDVDRGKPSELIGSVKLTGSAGGWRYGVLAALEDEVRLPGTVAATGESFVVREDGRSFGAIRALYETSGAGRRSIGYLGTIVTLPGFDSMTHGVDSHFLSTNGRWKVDTQFMYSDVENTDGFGAFLDANFTINSRWQNSLSLDYVDDKLDITDFGFIRRNDLIRARYGVQRKVAKGLGYFRRVSNSVMVTAQANMDGLVSDIYLFNTHSFTFPNRSRLYLNVQFHSGGWDDRNSRDNGTFKTDQRWSARFSYGTDSAKRFSWSSGMGTEQEELNGSWSFTSDIGFTYRPNDRFSLNFDLRFKKRNGWLLHTTEADFATFDADNLQPKLGIDFFINARQQLRMTMQWVAVNAKGVDHWRVPAKRGRLVPVTYKENPPNEDFTLSRLTAQLRYRWEIGPLSDMFIVYTRGSTLRGIDPLVGFGDLFTNAVNEPVVNSLVAKIRYRFEI